MRYLNRRVQNMIKFIHAINQFAARSVLDINGVSLLARLIFTGVFVGYFWSSALTKLGDGFFGFIHLSAGAYIQIFPKTVEQLEYDMDQLGVIHWIIAMMGTYSEFLLPAMIVLGLMTRLSAFGMIVFVCVQTLTDLYGHGVLADQRTVGAWFDRTVDSLIMDQRALWIFLLMFLCVAGGGRLSIDQWIKKRITAEGPA